MEQAPCTWNILVSDIIYLRRIESPEKDPYKGGLGEPQRLRVARCFPQIAAFGFYHSPFSGTRPQCKESPSVIASEDCIAVGNTPMIWMLALVACGVLAMLSIGAYTLRTGISPMPSTSRARAQILAALPPDSTGPLFELGSGWGTLAFPLADLFPHRQVIAYELSPLPYLVSRFRQRMVPRDNLSIRRENFFEVSLVAASVIVCYLCPPLMGRLEQKLEAEARPGTLVISNTFSFRKWSSENVHVLTDLYATRVYVYRVPAARRPTAHSKRSPGAIG